MTKKLLITITILLMLIISMFGVVCYADSTNDILYNSSNSNVSNVSLNNDNQTTNINDLYTNGYRSIISRYSNRMVHITIEFTRLQFEFDYGVSNFTSSDNSAIRQYLRDLYANNLFENYQGLNNLEATNILDNTTYSIEVNVNVSGSGYMECYYDLYGSISFDMPLKNLQLIESNNAVSLNFSVINRNIFPSKFTVNNKSTNLVQVYVNRFNYLIYYDFNYLMQNVDKIYLFSEFQLFDNGNLQYNFNYNVSKNIMTNGRNYQLTSNQNVISRFSCMYTLLNDSKVNNISISCTSTQGWSRASYSGNNDDFIALHLSIFTPFFASDNEYIIQNNTNGSITPLKLEYYDAKWYELHYQIANAFIFLITELPIISNITNAVYSTINVIQIAFNTISQFSAFVYIFAFGMFALVFGILIKLFIGD